MKQRGIRQSNQKEITQKGTNIKKKSSHQERSSKCSTASRAECFIVGVDDLTDGELARRLLQRLNGGVDRQAVRQLRCTELPHRFKPSCRSELPGCYESSRHSDRHVVLNRPLQCRLSKSGRLSSVPGLSLGL